MDFFFFLNILKTLVFLKLFSKPTFFFFFKYFWYSYTSSQILVLHDEITSSSATEKQCWQQFSTALWNNFSCYFFCFDGWPDPDFSVIFLGCITWFDSLRLFGFPRLASPAPPQLASWPPWGKMTFYWIFEIFSNL